MLIGDGHIQNEKANVESVSLQLTALASAVRAQNAGMAFVSLKPWEERSGDENKVRKQ